MPYDMILGLHLHHLPWTRQRRTDIIAHVNIFHLSKILNLRSFSAVNVSGPPTTQDSKNASISLLVSSISPIPLNLRVGKHSASQATSFRLQAGEKQLEELRKERVLGQFTASALAGNAVLGSVFYTLPAVVAVGGIYSPISLFIATLILFLWRPIMEELASALPISAAPYTYILNVSTKSLALVGAALLLLDFASTSVVSAATAATYLAGEVSLPFPTWVGAAIVLAIFTLVSLTGVKESARIALVVLSWHVRLFSLSLVIIALRTCAIFSMLLLMIAAIVHWANIGNSQLRDNWNTGRIEGFSPTSILRQVYFGFCLGMLGLTGFECIPAYVSRIKPGNFPQVLRNLHYPTTILNTVMMVLVLAVIPLDIIEGGANVLSILAQNSAGKWLRIWIAVDAVIVLCGGVLTGILSACELLEQLALHRVIPKIFLRVLPKSGSPYVSVLSFSAFGAMLYASAGASLNVISQMFSLVWLTVMSLFPISLFLLKFNRGRLQRNAKTKLSVIFAAFVVSLAVFAGNVAVNPKTVGYFAAYFIGIVAFFSATQNKISLLRYLYWVGLIMLMRRLRQQPVCILAKNDEISRLSQMILYVRKNEETSNVKIIHFYEEEDGVPSELEANAKILDEAFPDITVDLILVNGNFNPANIAALAHNLDIPTSLMFMTCPGEHFPCAVADLGHALLHSEAL
ncbi:amino acid permease-domain-containing protein [Cyathus striatus]|nr:amino acid permease-domain-containing protein [Cyathus striatus]